MARKVKCRITGTVGTSDTFYKADNGLYYQTKEIYDEYKSEAEYYKKIVDFICIELLEYSEGCVFPTILTRKLKALSAYSNKVIWATILYKEDALRYWASVKDKFKDDTGKICYLMSIIVNSINEVQKKVKKKELEERRINATLPPTVGEINNKQNSNKDISKWLEEDEI